MKKWNSILWILGVALACVLIWRLAPRSGAGGEEEASAPEATIPVTMGELSRGSIERTLSAYGAAVALPAAQLDVSYPFECRVISVLASPGQPVKAGDPLLKIEPSADSRLELESARNAAEAAGLALQDVQSKFASRLATNQDLLAAQGAARDAQIKLENLQRRTLPPDGVVRADAPAIVTRIPAQPGSINAAGSSLVEMAIENQLEARVGVGVADADEVQPGEPASLALVETSGTEQAAPIPATVRLVGRSVDPSTRLVDAFLTIGPSDEPVLIGSFLHARIVVEKKQALLAPRAAVIPQPEDGNAIVFTVKEGHAVKHVVAPGIDDGVNVEIVSSDPPMAPGDGVVLTGASELDDGAPVDTQQKPDAAP
jgi:RND family efflux transporter MFP subunit